MTKKVLYLTADFTDFLTTDCADYYGLQAAEERKLKVNGLKARRLDDETDLLRILFS